MKNLTLLLTILITIVTSLLSCKKDTSSFPNNTYSSERDTNAPTFDLAHGMFVLPSMVSAENYVHNLETQEEDRTALISAYTTLGVGTDEASLPNLTDHPICLLHGMSMSFVSKRQVEETAINTLLNSGQEVFSIIQNPYWKTVLNSDGSVIIANRIFRFFDNGGIAVITNNDWNLYNDIKNQEFQDIKSTFNLLLIDDTREGWQKLFNIQAAGEIIDERKIFLPRFIKIPNSDGTAQIKNVSCVEGGGNQPITFKWLYENGTHSLGLLPDRQILASEQLRVEIADGFGSNTVQTLEPCATDYVVITKLSNNQFKFEIPGWVNAPNAVINWEFSDGSVSTTNPVTKTITSPSTSSVTCKIINPLTNTVICARTFPIVVICGVKSSLGVTDYIVTDSGERWKVESKIYISGNKVGAYMKYLKKFGPIYKPANNEGVCVDINGKWKYTFNNSGVLECKDRTGTGSKCLGEGTWPTSIYYEVTDNSNPVSNPNMLNSGHKIKVDGKWYGRGVSLPRLILP